ncbi:MAG: hypothetical protein Q8Q81_02780 [Oxalobacteraceae bacterium]|nr:hypothetical protein [Oxalobacteraceae bacterium]
MKYVLAALGAALLSGCGTVKVETVRVPTGELARYMGTPGIYYALPRSEVTVAFPVTLERQLKGLKGNIIEACIEACGTPQQTADNISPPACAVPTANDTIILGRPELTLRSVQDFNHLYRLNVDGGFLDGVKHAVAVSENGVLSESTSTVSNQSADLFLGIVSQLGKIAAAGILDQPAAPTGLTCKAAREIASREARFQKDIQDVEQQRTKFLVPRPGVAPVLSADHIKLADDRLRSRIAEIQADRDKYRAKEDLAEVKKTFKSRLVSQPLVPAENAPLAPVRLQFRELVESESAAFLSVKIREVLNTALTISAGVTPSSPDGASATWHLNGTEPAVAGYRYRVPLPGVLKVTCRGSATAQSVCSQNIERTLIEEELPIAQYGSLASLPVEFKGKSATVGLALHPTTGGIKKVDLGIEPIGAKPILDTLDGLRTSQEDKRKREAGETQAELDADKNQLTRDRDLLKLKKEIRDLQKELGTTP